MLTMTTKMGLLQQQQMTTVQQHQQQRPQPPTALQQQLAAAAAGVAGAAAAVADARGVGAREPVARLQARKGRRVLVLLLLLLLEVVGVPLVGRVLLVERGSGQQQWWKRRSHLRLLLHRPVRRSLLLVST
jgi:hypothetical protein